MYHILFVVPSEPQSFQVVSINSSSVTLQWRPPATPNGIITQYSVQFDTTVINFSSNMLLVTVDGLSPETLYLLRLRARTSVGEGPPSSVTVITCKLFIMC